MTNPPQIPLETLIRKLYETTLKQIRSTDYFTDHDVRYEKRQTIIEDSMSLNYGDEKILLKNREISIGEEPWSMPAKSIFEQLIPIIAQRGGPDSILYSLRYQDLERTPLNLRFSSKSRPTLSTTYDFSQVRQVVLNGFRGMAKQRELDYDTTNIQELATAIYAHDNQKVIARFLDHLDKAPMSYHEYGSDESERYRRESVFLVWSDGSRRFLKQSTSGTEWNVVQDEQSRAPSIRTQITDLVTEFGTPTSIIYRYETGGRSGNASDGPSPKYRDEQVTFPFSEVQERILGK